MPHDLFLYILCTSDLSVLSSSVLVSYFLDWKLEQHIVVLFEYRNEQTHYMIHVSQFLTLLVI